MADRSREVPTAGSDAQDVERVFERLERGLNRRRRPVRANRSS